MVTHHHRPALWSHRSATAAEEASQLRDMLSLVINKAVMVAIEQEQAGMMDQLEQLANGLEDINIALKEGTQVRPPSGWGEDSFGLMRNMGGGAWTYVLEELRG